MQAAIKADILAYYNLLMKDINIGGDLLSVEGSKPVEVGSESSQKKFDYIVYVAAESSWENNN